MRSVKNFAAISVLVGLALLVAVWSIQKTAPKPCRDIVQCLELEAKKEAP